MDVLREGARMICRKIKMVDLEILQVGQSCLAEGFGGRWSPNHATDLILTRWEKDSKGNKIIHAVSGKNILQFVAIKRKGCGEWAIPGRTVDQERRSVSHRRENLVRNP